MKKKSQTSKKPTLKRLSVKVSDKSFSPTAEDAAAFGYDPKWRSNQRRRQRLQRVRLERAHATRLMKAFCRGYDCKNKQRGEDYLTVLNHLAEGTYDPRLMTKMTLAECLGWMQREHGHMVEHMSDINSRLLQIATESLIGQMEKGLFKKGRGKAG
jgi:hypothetical protein